MNNKSTDFFCGSRLNSDPKLLQKNIISLSDFVQKKICNGDSIEDAHNYFCAYSILLMAYSTGHRPVIDMFCFREDIDLEGRLIAINDKVSSTSNNNRLCAFDENTKEQIENYLSHIKTLAELAYKAGHLKEAQQINSLSNNLKASKQSIPLFFFINAEFKIINITPKALTKQLRDVWPYEKNHNRHHLETTLSKHTHRFLIDIHLGHQQIQNHLQGANTSLSSFDCLSQLNSLLNLIQKELNWPCLKGLKSKGVSEVPHKLHKPKSKFGYLKREETRIENIKNLELEVKEILYQEIYEAGGIDAYASKTNLDYQTIARVLEECEGKASISSKAISIFIDLLNKKLKECKSPPIQKIQILNHEESPFPNRWLSNFVAGRTARENFVKELIQYGSERRENNKPDINEQWARVVASSVLFGAFYNPTWVSYIIETGPSQLQKFKKWVYFIDIWSNEPVIEAKTIPLKFQSPSWRWQPDPLTRTLLLQMLKNHGNFKNYSSKKAKSYLTTISNELGIKTSKSNTSSDAMCKHMQAFWSFYLPAYIKNLFISKSTTTPLPQHSLARLYYSKYLPTNLNPPLKTNKNKLNPIEIKNKKNLKDYLSLIRLELNEVNANNSNSPKTQRDNLSDKISFIHEHNSFPPIASSLSQWLLHMCEFGTAKLNDPTVSTIDTYFSTISLPLALHIGNEDLTDFDDEEITLLYKNIIKSGEDYKSKSYRAARLIYFHKIMTLYENTECESLDWIDIAGKHLPTKHLKGIKVNSNIITGAEYNECIEQIKDSQLSEYNKSWIANFIIIAYRFGLRVSEIRRLRHQDIQRFGNDIIIQCQNTKHGRTKSRSSVRQVPLLGSLSQIEHDFINNHIETAKSNHGYSLNDLLFYSSTDNSKPLEKNIIWNQIHHILRKVTGDFRIRFHHLRHSYLNSQYFGNLKTNSFKIFEELGRTPWNNLSFSAKGTLIENDAFQTYALSSLSASAGHSNQNTTITSYLHLIDDVALGYAETAPWPKISIKELSLITGDEETTLYNRMKKKGLHKGEFNAHELLKTVQIGDEIKKYQHKQLKFPCFSSSTNRTLENLTLSEINEILKNHYTDNTSMDFLAYHKSVPAEAIEELFRIAKVLENESGFEYFNLNKNYWLPTHKTHSQISLNQEQVAIEGTLKKTQALLNDKDKYQRLLSMTKIWLAANEWHEPSSVFIFKEPNSIKSFMGNLKLFGYNINDFTFRFSNSLNENESHLIFTKLKKLGIKKTNIMAAKFRMLSSGKSKQRLNYVSVKFSKKFNSKTLAKNMLSLNRIFFILAIKLKINATF